eukprot:5006353-Karenia_brevis.AAC.1
MGCLHNAFQSKIVPESVSTEFPAMSKLVADLHHDSRATVWARIAIVDMGADDHDDWASIWENLLQCGTIDEVDKFCN